MVRKLDAHKVAFDLGRPDATAERIFDGFAILPRHRLEQAYREGPLGDAWGLNTPPVGVETIGRNHPGFRQGGLIELRESIDVDEVGRHAVDHFPRNIRTIVPFSI